MHKKREMELCSNLSLYFSDLSFFASFKLCLIALSNATDHIMPKHIALNIKISAPMFINSPKIQAITETVAFNQYFLKRKITDIISNPTIGRNATHPCWMGFNIKWQSPACRISKMAFFTFSKYHAHSPALSKTEFHCLLFK